jgi:hypothetical protein
LVSKQLQKIAVLAVGPIEEELRSVEGNRLSRAGA